MHNHTGAAVRQLPLLAPGEGGLEQMAGREEKGWRIPAVLCARNSLSLSHSVHNQEIEVHVRYSKLSVCHDVEQKRQSKEIDHDCVKPSLLKMLKAFMVNFNKTIDIL